MLHAEEMTDGKMNRICKYSLAAFGILYFVWGSLILINGLLMVASIFGINNTDDLSSFSAVTFIFASLGCGTLVILAGIGLFKRRFYGLNMAFAFLMFLYIPIGMIVGICIIAVLCKTDVRRAFGVLKNKPLKVGV